MQIIHHGIVGRGFQFASGAAVGREEKASPFGGPTIAIQYPFFLEEGVDLEALVPGFLRWGTINVELGRNLVLRNADYTRTLDWTVDQEDPKARTGPETFSLIHCCFVYSRAGPDAYYPGLIYYPHPETKPRINRHKFDVLEVLTVEVKGLVYGVPASIVCRADAFVSL